MCFAAPSLFVALWLRDLCRAGVEAARGVGLPFTVIQGMPSSSLATGDLIPVAPEKKVLDGARVSGAVLDMLLARYQAEL